MPTTPRYPSLPHYRSRLIPRGRISTNGVSRPVTLPNDPSQHYSRLGSARSRSKTPILLQLEVQSDQVQQAAPQKRAAKVAEQIWWQHLRAREWSGIGTPVLKDLEIDFFWDDNGFLGFSLGSKWFSHNRSFLVRHIFQRMSLQKTIPFQWLYKMMCSTPVLYWTNIPEKHAKAWGPGLEGPVVGGTLVSHQKCIRLARK